ncbi:hypothetical protein IJH23_00150 [Candidatus Saccharibacteria bacterium]|nr:hypothetical protein [Candidatus Saccharibacteria bacterium]
MNIYISGVSGTGMGPLALMAKEAGLNVFGSDLHKGRVYDELVKAGIPVFIGKQDGEFLKEKMAEGVDWFVHTSALPYDHPELVLAKESGLKVSKRDELTAYLVKELGAKMVAVAGTHGKSTTVAMIVFTSLKLKIPVSYIAGAALKFAPTGAYTPGSRYFVYEADEFDRNFLHFYPWLAVLPSVTYDHAEIYHTPEEYLAAFAQFKSQSENVIEKPENFKSEDFKLAGEVRRKDASFAAEAVLKMAEDAGISATREEISEILNQFPGISRRFERICEGVHSDYAHHPEEVKATVEIALEEKELQGKKGVVVVYQPYQNRRQYDVKQMYKDIFKGVDKLFWLPTYLLREEHSELAVLSPKELISEMENSEIAEPAEMNEKLKEKLDEYLAQKYLIVVMAGGDADDWIRENYEE